MFDTYLQGLGTGETMSIYRSDRGYEIRKRSSNTSPYGEILSVIENGQMSTAPRSTPESDPCDCAAEDGVEQGFLAASPAWQYAIRLDMRVNKGHVAQRMYGTVHAAANVLMN